MEQIKIFDTTLRDGEQSPGCSMNLNEKIEIARSLERMKVDVIEAGFAVSSPGDFEAVKTIAGIIKDCTVASLARANKKDIDAAYEALKEANDPRIHIFLATSPLHMEYKLKMTPEQVLEKVEEAVSYAAKYCPNIEFSAEDAMRSNPDFLVRVAETAIRCGASVINVPDTVGYTTPSEMQAMIKFLIENVKNADKAIFSVHCHNDLGMGVANSLAGILGGAMQIECTVNGLGERAGNASLEEIVMAMHTRPDVFLNLPRLDTTRIYQTCKTVYNIIGQSVPINKPIVGKNAFSHEAGIHQHGVLANKKTYEILTPEAVGIKKNQLVLGKHSGEHAFRNHLVELGYELTPEELKKCFEKFKELCDKKKIVTSRDIEALVSYKSVDSEGYSLERYDVHSGNFITATSVVRLKKGEKIYQDVSLGDGPIDAAYNAIDKIIAPVPHTLETYMINSVSEGKDTLGEVIVKLCASGKTFSGRGLSTDIIEASILAYLNAVNKMQDVLGAE